MKWMNKGYALRSLWSLYEVSRPLLRPLGGDDPGSKVDKDDERSRCQYHGSFLVFWWCRRGRCRSAVIHTCGSEARWVG